MFTKIRCASVIFLFKKLWCLQKSLEKGAQPQFTSQRTRTEPEAETSWMADSQRNWLSLAQAQAQLTLTLNGAGDASSLRMPRTPNARYPHILQELEFRAQQAATRQPAGNDTQSPGKQRARTSRRDRNRKRENSLSRSLAGLTVGKNIWFIHVCVELNCLKISKKLNKIKING